MADVGNLLKKKSLRKTVTRSKILELMVDESIAMSEREIGEKLDGSFDRVTIYRTLHTFLNNGLVHKVLDGNGGTKYALCQHDCEENGKHHHDHVHFSCQVCKQTHCIEQVQLPSMNLPDGFQVKEVNVLFEGICPNCK
ncbi:MAG: transcriptional repressor [Bacteroidia bacterium]|nr:transcriptional repressor [Bacteroidia bacterium]